MLAFGVALFGSLLVFAAPSKHVVVFHSNIPSNLYVNAAHGTTHIKKDDSSKKTKIINLLLYPTDKVLKIILTYFLTQKERFGCNSATFSNQFPGKELIF